MSIKTNFVRDFFVDENQKLTILLTDHLDKSNIKSNLSGVDIDRLKVDLSGNFFEASANEEIGNIFFDNNLKKLIKYKEETVKAWSNSLTVNTGRYDLSGIGSSDDDAIIFGGRELFNSSDKTEVTDGVSWSYASNMNNAIEKHASAGSTTTLLSFGGDDDTSISEEYDGTSWSISIPLNFGRGTLTGFGEKNSCLSIGGYRNSNKSNIVESFNGTSWSTESSILTSRFYLTGAGITTAGLITGGSDENYLSSTEEYNGTSWSISSNLINARNALSSSGVQNSCLCFSGYNSQYTNFTEEYDGTSWLAQDALIISKSNGTGCGNLNINSSTLLISGRSLETWFSLITEKYVNSIVSKVALEYDLDDESNLFRVSWELKNTMLYSRLVYSGDGDSNSYILGGGRIGYESDNDYDNDFTAFSKYRLQWYNQKYEEYDGQNWKSISELTDQSFSTPSTVLNTLFKTDTGCKSIGGFSYYCPISQPESTAGYSTNNTWFSALPDNYEYNDTTDSWSTFISLPTKRMYPAVGGDKSGSGLIVWAGAVNSPQFAAERYFDNTLSDTNIWDGVSWSTGPVGPTATGNFNVQSSAGTINDFTVSSTLLDLTFHNDGTAWSFKASLDFGQSEYAKISGENENNILIMATNKTLFYDGTTFSECEGGYFTQYAPAGLLSVSIPRQNDFTTSNITSSGLVTASTYEDALYGGLGFGQTSKVVQYNLS